MLRAPSSCSRPSTRASSASSCRATAASRPGSSDMNVGVLVSGTGTNLQALLDAEAAGALAPAQITIVISNNPSAPALARATAAGKPALAIDHRGLSREAFEDLLIAGLRDVELVVLAGFMRVLTPHFLTRFPRPVINTHPSLLPAFPGMDAPGQAISAGA